MSIFRSCLAPVFVCIFGVVAAGVESEDIPYRIAQSRWKPALGNHRAVVRVEGKEDAVWAHLPWRRHDARPEDKDIVVVDAATGREVRNKVPVEVNREFADIVFQGLTAPGEYYIYYLPQAENAANANDAAAYRYAPRRNTAERAWLERHGLTADRLRDGRWRALPKAAVREFQTWSEFHRFDPMEVIATAAETKELLSKSGRAYLLFPEDRKYPIRMSDDLPLRWIRRGPSDEFRGEACRGEFYAFQVGVFAARQAVRDLAVEISDLRPAGDGVRVAAVIPAANFHAFNFRGVDWLGRPIKRQVDVARGKWPPCGLASRFRRARPRARTRRRLPSFPKARSQARSAWP